MADLTLSLSGVSSNLVIGNASISISTQLASQIININTGNTAFGIKFPSKCKLHFDIETKYFAILDKL